MKRTTMILSCCLCAMLMSGACTSGSQDAAPKGAGGVAAPRASSGMQSIDPRHAMDMIRTRKDLLVVDVRTPQELVEGSIEGSVMVPFWSVMKGDHGLPRDKAILVVCAVGGRSYAAGQRLAGSGYPEVYNLSGGIAAWKQAGLPVK